MRTDQEQEQKQLFAADSDGKKERRRGWPLRFRSSRHSWVAGRCRETHPAIDIDPDILGGIPHIKGTRLAVTQVLSRIQVEGSIQAVVEYYSPDISAEQINQAIDYAREILELVCVPYQTNG